MITRGSVLRNLFHFSGIVVPLVYLLSNRRYTLILSLFSFPVHVVLVAAFVSTLTELFSSRYFDDNLSIPIAAVIVLSMIK